MILNTGHSVMFYLENGTKNHINITGGPLSYKYQVYEIHIHYGQQDEMGSEHSINGYSFPAEVYKSTLNLPFIIYQYYDHTVFDVRYFVQNYIYIYNVTFHRTHHIVINLPLTQQYNTVESR